MDVLCIATRMIVMMNGHKTCVLGCGVILHRTCKLLVSFGHLRAVGVHAHPSMGLINMLNGLLTLVVLIHSFIHSYNHCPQSHGFNRSINLLLTFVEFDTLS